MWIITPPSSTIRRASAAYSAGVYGIAGHWLRSASDPEIEHVMMTGSSTLMGASPYPAAARIRPLAACRASSSGADRAELGVGAELRHRVADDPPALHPAHADPVADLLVGELGLEAQLQRRALLGLQHDHEPAQRGAMLGVLEAVLGDADHV